MIKGKYGKITLEPKEEKFIKENFYSMTNSELANALGLRLTKFRTFAYAMGLKRIEFQYWTPEQVEFLRSKYQEIGDTELAEIFTAKWDKPKGWNKKHIEKKRRYLKLKRTNTEKEAIQIRNTKKGRFAICNKKRWDATGVTEVGTIKKWSRKNGSSIWVIKLKNGFTHYYRWLWIQKYGPIPTELYVTPKKGISKEICTVEDLETITRAENARRNSEARMQYPEEYRLAKRLINKIEKQLNK